MTREILITPVLNGFICQVGCQKVVFTSFATMVAELDLYYRNPEETEKKYIREAVNKMSDCGIATPMNTIATDRNSIQADCDPRRSRNDIVNTSVGASIAQESYPINR